MARQGLKPGQRHSGSFIKGDPRIYVPKGPRLVPGTNHTLPELCRLRTIEALDVIVQIVQDKNAPIDVRRKAADSLLDRGWGKPEQTVQLEDNTASGPNLKAMATRELMALLLDKEERTVEGQTLDVEKDKEGLGPDMD